ncbi:MAG TPA: hypothetical protein VFJ58_10650 [Armatimonadota bacterium]|nr:hypothetical protein [Armatimonadota bacterium]
MILSEVYGDRSPGAGENSNLQDWSETGLYVHALPGRLRIEIPALKRDPHLPPRIRTAMAAIPGVQRVEVSDFTRRALINYDPALVNQTVLIGRLRLMGCFESEEPAPVIRSARHSDARIEPGPLSHPVSKLLLKALAEALAKSLVEALFALLL